VAILVLVAGVCAATACQPPDADPSHVYIKSWVNPQQVFNGSGYVAHIDKAEVTVAPWPSGQDGPATPMTFSQATILPGTGVVMPPFVTPDGTTTVRVFFTLVGAKNPDGSPVTGSAAMAWVARAIQ